MGWGRGVVAVGTVVLWLGLLLEPETALRVWWGGIVPALPALWMVAPAVWRSHCPLAVLEIASGPRSGRRVDATGSVVRGCLGIGLFALLVPARPLLFDRSGVSLAAALAAAALAAALRGRTHAVRAGFCNTLCPFGAVERLYGQRPLFHAAAAHWTTCEGCTARGCPDVAGAKAMRQLLGPVRDGLAWLRRPHGVFAAGMPGFVVGYALRGGEPSWAGAYLGPGIGAAASWLLVLGISALVPASSRRVPPVLAAMSALAFYGLVAPAAVSTWDVRGLATLVRVLGGCVIVAWILGWRPPTAPGRVSPESARGGVSLPVLRTQPG